MSSRPASIDDVAKRAGVSRSAVSRAYTPGASVAPATRERIEAAALALSYRPNLLARSLSRRRSRTIAIAVTRLENPFNAILLQHLALGVQQRGYGVRLIVSEGDHGADTGLDEVLRHGIDALIVCAVDMSSSLHADYAAYGVPVVMVNRRTSEADAHCIVSDNHQGGRAIGRYLLAAGHRRLAFVAGTTGSSTSHDREQGFAQALAEEDLTPRIVAGHWNAADAARATRTLLDADDLPEAIFYANDHMALAGWTVIEAEYGLVVGRDIAIVGYDDIPQAREGRGLTTYAQPIGELATRAIDTALSLIEDVTCSSARFIEGTLIVRGSAFA